MQINDFAVTSRIPTLFRAQPSAAAHRARASPAISSALNWFQPRIAPTYFDSLAGAAGARGASVWVLLVMTVVAWAWPGLFMVAPPTTSRATRTASSISMCPRPGCRWWCTWLMAFWAGDRPDVAHAGLSSKSWRWPARPPAPAFTVIMALWTGALWGKPTWGAWWVWDARLTSELRAAVPLPGRDGPACQAIDDPAAPTAPPGCWRWWAWSTVPVIYFSVKWWNTLHQGADHPRVQGESSMDPTPMLPPLMLVMVIGTKLCVSHRFAGCWRARADLVLEREAGKPTGCAKNWARSGIDTAHGSAAP